MDNIQNEGNATPTPEELKQEEEVLQEVREDEVRNKIIEDYGLDEDDNDILIDKLTKKEIEQRKAFGKVIEQKRKWREKASVQPEIKPSETMKAEAQKMSGDPADIERIINEKLEERELQALDCPEDLKAEIKKLAKVQGISVKQAFADPYIQYKKEDMERDQRNTEASASGTRKGTALLDETNIPEFDYSTEEGRKKAKEWRDALTKKATK